MNKSESIKELAMALAKAQGRMKGALKDSSNPFFKAKYADLASVVEAIREAFSSNGLSYIQTIHPTEKEEVAVETTILHSSGEWLCCGVLALPVSKHDAQSYGSALTYARRYSLSAAAGVAPEDDDGNAAAMGAPAHTTAKPEPAKAKISPAEREALILDRFSPLRVNKGQLEAQMGKKIALASKADLEAAYAHFQPAPAPDLTGDEA